MITLKEKYMNNSRERIVQAKHYLEVLGKVETRTQFGGYSLAIEKVVFAIVVEGELYLRVCKQIESYCCEKPMLRLIFNKRGRPIELNYYHVDGTLWSQPDTLVKLSYSALKYAQHQLQKKFDNQRVKDLPNMGVRLEIMLSQVGICNVQSLRMEGARNCWLKLKAHHKNLGINTLFALEGAISGRHQEVLPNVVKQELRDWFNSKVNVCSD